MPEVSVIIPIYNTAAYLRKALDSAGFENVPILTTDPGDTKGIHPGVSMLGARSVLLAAWAFCRSSPRLYDRLLAHPCLGAYVRNFREYRAIPLHAKIISVTLIWATLLYCIFGVVRAWWWAQAGLLLLAVGLTWHILSYATLRRPE